MFSFFNKEKEKSMENLIKDNDEYIKKLFDDLEKIESLKAFKKHFFSIIVNIVTFSIMKINNQKKEPKIFKEYDWLYIIDNFLEISAPTLCKEKCYCFVTISTYIPITKPDYLNAYQILQEIERNIVMLCNLSVFGGNFIVEREATLPLQLLHSASSKNDYYIRVGLYDNNNRN